ncbi:SpoIIE family protein phosphatase [Streptomyces sp. ICBB 8177]|uniref:SpoIIE family protein phosphatase n=1 Tax=Streptomyces sp. ICBB 8177 TaxID=563922 RepID=UPI001F546025|nr:SpoIIE family protein phosphatase [Streptomyces sp. ICBB 8177]
MDKTLDDSHGTSRPPVTTDGADAGRGDVEGGGAQEGVAPVPGIAALLRLAVVAVDTDGRVSYWNRGAQELFGHRWESVHGHRAAGLLAAPVPTSPGQLRDATELLDDLTRPCWAGRFPVTDRDGAVRDVLWWSYRVAEPAGRSLLVLAAHATPLRTGGLRVAVGDRLLPYALVGEPGTEGVRVTARLAAPMDHESPAGPTETAGPADRLGAVLPRVSPGRLERITREITRLGPPALEIEGTAVLPVLPYEALPYEAARSGGAVIRPDETVAAPGRPTAAATAVSATRRPARRSVPRRRAELLPAPRDTAPPTAYDPTTTHDPTTYDPARTYDSPAAYEGPTGVAADALTPVPAFPPVVPGTVLDEQLALLRETGTRVGTTLELDATAAELCAVAVPRFADFATVLLVDQVFSDAASDTGPDPHGADPHGTATGPRVVRRIAVAKGSPHGPWSRALPEGELYTIPAGHAPALDEPFLLPVVDPTIAAGLAEDLGVPALAPLLPGRSVLLTPLTARGTVLGRMCFVREPQRRPFDATDAATAAELAARGAVHLDNARLHRMESRAAATLQRSMLPTSPPRIPGVRIAHHYRPGDRQAQVGGDWFDAVQLPGGRVALVVGDVMGHGLLSAAVMGQFRTAVQTMAALDLPPAQLLRHLDNLAQRLGADHLATCVYAVYDPIHRTLALANAGHIPPVLVRGDGRGELLSIPEGAPIGVGGVPFETVEIPVPDGSWLVLCTDGLVEVRGEGIDAGLAALCSNVIEPQQTPEDVCDQILSRVHSEDRRDDVALLVARFEGIASADVAEWQLALDPSEVRTARAVTRKQLAQWGLGQLSDLTELLVSELVTNALRVASHEVQLRLMRVGKLLVEVSDDNHNLPQLRRADAVDEHGRGLALVSNLSRRWGTSRKAVGKVVWFELPLPKE